MIKILVAGYSGSMGQQVLKLIDETPDFELVAVFALGATENDRQRLGLGEQVKIYNELSQIEQGADVWIDFTAPSAVFENVKFALKHGMCPVVGTTGLTDEELVELKQLALAQQLGGLVGMRQDRWQPPHNALHPDKMQIPSQNSLLLYQEHTTPTEVPLLPLLQIPPDIDRSLDQVYSALSYP